MLSEDIELQGIGAAVGVPDWLKGLLRAVRSEAIKPKDPRVKSLWDLLRQRELLSKNLWLKEVLRRIWDKGLLVPRPRPRTTTRIVQSLRLLSILPPLGGGAAAHRPLTPAQAVRPVALKPVGSVRPAAMQPVRRAAVKAARK
jgi:hypothetical protein